MEFSLYIYIYIYIYVCMCVCSLLKNKRTRETKHNIVLSLSASRHIENKDTSWGQATILARNVISYAMYSVFSRLLLRRGSSINDRDKVLFHSGTKDPI
jgi:hypothetical protein